MIRQSPSRNQRSKGIKVKHVLQICFLLAICLWLVYQVKHSQNKKKEFDDGDVKTSQQTQGGVEIVKLGRKDLNPKVEDNATGTRNHDEEDENAGEEEDNKIEEENAEDKTKPEEKGDEVDEHEEDKSDAEVDQEEDVVDEDKEIVENDSEENNGRQMDNENSTEEHDDDEQTHEAREEHYKADDASSAVTHETETENGNATKSNNLAGTNIVENEQPVNSTVGDEAHESKVNDREMIEVGNLTNTVDNKEMENFESKPDNSSESGDHSILGNSTMEVSIGNTNLSSGNVTEKESELSQVENATTEGTTSEVTTSGLNSSNTSLISSENQTDLSSTTSTQMLDTVLKYGESSSSTDILSAPISEQLVKPSNETEEATNYDSGAAEETRSNDGENDVSNNGAEEESEGTLETEDPEEIQHDLIDASDSAIGGLEEKDVRTDLETLPDIQTEGSNDDDGAAAE